MMSRYGLWLVCVGALSLAGCANWQGRLGNRTPGSAATMAPPPPAAGGSLISAPGSSMSEPPPPMAPPASGFGQGLEPLDGPQKLDISSIDAAPAAPSGDRKVSSSAVPNKMYNLDGGPSHKSESSSSRKSSTLSKLASKAATEERAEVSEKVEAPTRSRSPLATVKKLSADASAESAAEKPVAKSAPAEPPPKVAAPAPAEAAPAAPNGVAAGSSLPQPAVASPATRTAPAAEIDTTLLAQPVRKGAGEEKKESKGPQSNAGELPGFFTGKHKPSIYPVSNPAPAERVDLGRFS